MTYFLLIQEFVVLCSTVSDFVVHEDESTRTREEVSDESMNNLTVACQGLSLERIRRVLSKIIAQYGEIKESSPELILQEKKQIIQQSQLLEFCIADKKLSDLGGLENFKDWLKVRSEAFSQAAIEYGLPYPVSFFGYSHSEDNQRLQEQDQ